MALLGRLFIYLIMVPLYLGSLLFVTGLTCQDIYVHGHIHSQLEAMEPAESKAGQLWTTPDNRFALLAGRIEAQTISDPMLIAAGGPAACVVEHVQVEEYVRHSKSSSWDDIMNATTVGANPHIGAYNIDEAFLKLHNFERTPQAFGRDSNFGKLCSASQRACRIHVWCLGEQDITVMGNLEGSTITYPKLHDTTYPLTQMDRLNPEKFGTQFDYDFQKYTLSTISFILIAYFLLIFRGGRRDFTGMLFIVLVAATTLVPYHLLFSTGLAYLASLMVLGTGIYLLLNIFKRTRSATTPAANKPVKPAALLRGGKQASIPGYGTTQLGAQVSANTTQTPLPAGTQSDDLIAPAVKELKVRLNPLTIEALSPAQLDKTVALHLERMAPERWDKMPELQRINLIGKIVVALKSVR